MYCLAEELYRSEDGLCLMRLHNFVNLSARLHLAELLFQCHVNGIGCAERISVKLDLIRVL